MHAPSLGSKMQTLALLPEAMVSDYVKDMLCLSGDKAR
jgi:hypothetical protein